MKLLSKPQINHMRALMTGERGSYPGLNIGVLNSLKMRGLVSAKYGLGSIAMPHTSIKWSLTADGSKFIMGYDLAWQRDKERKEQREKT